LEALAQRNDDYRLVRIDIGNWGSPVAKQYAINQLPAVWLYDGTTLVTQDTRGALQQLPAPQ
jgi:hypothetical protein